MPLHPGALAPTWIQPRDFAHYRDLWRQAERREILTAHPLNLDIELTSQCNLSCRMCWQSGELKAPGGYMADDLFKRLVDQGVAAGMASVKLQVRGESLLHPRIAALTAYAKQAGVLDVHLTTNGTLFGLKPRLLDDMLAAGLDKLIFSIDPAHDESARAIYGAQRAPDLAAIVGRCLNVRKDRRPLVRIQSFALGNQTTEERLAELRQAFPDADEYMVNPLWNSKWDEDSLVGLSTHYRLLPCYFLWTRLTVFWNGGIAQCCRDYNGMFLLGDANRQAIRDIWLGGELTKLREAHLAEARALIPLCDRCDVGACYVGEGPAPSAALWITE